MDTHTPTRNRTGVSYNCHTRQRNTYTHSPVHYRKSIPPIAEAEAETELEMALTTLLGTLAAAVLNPTRNFMSRIPGVNTTRSVPQEIRVSIQLEDNNSPILPRPIFQDLDPDAETPRRTYLSTRITAGGKDTVLEFERPIDIAITVA